MPVENDCTAGQTMDNWKHELVRLHFGVEQVREEDGGEKRVDKVSGGGGGEIAEEKVENERGFKIDDDDNDANNNVVNASENMKSVNADGSGEWIEKKQHDFPIVSVLWNDSFKVEVEDKADDHQNQDDVLSKAVYVQNVKDIENKVETVIFGDDNNVVKVEDVDGLNLKKVGKDEHLTNLVQDDVEVLVADRLDHIYENLIAQRMELEKKTKLRVRQGLTEKKETILVGIQKLTAELKEDTAAIVELKEKLYVENEFRRNILDKIAREAGNKMNEDFARRKFEKEMNSLSNLETFEADVHRMHPPSLALSDQRRATCVFYEAPRLSFCNILSLTWKSENQEGSNYFSGLLSFLRSISSFVVAVVEEGKDIFLELSSYGCQELNKVLSVHTRDEGRDWTQLDALQPRYRCKPDELNNNYWLDFIMRPECISKQSKDQLVQEIKAAGGTVHYVAHKVRCTFSTKHEYVRALTSTRLVCYHTIYLSRDNLELTWGTGDNNHYRGSLCLTESNMLSIYWIGEQEAGYAECLSAFLKDSRIKEVLLGSNIKLLIIFHNLSSMITSLHDYCQAGCNTLELLIRMPVRCKLVFRSGYFSLLCPSTVVKQDLHSYRHMCRMKLEPRRICSKFKLCLVNILRERDFQLKYPEIVFNHTHFLCKDGDTLPRRIPPAEPVHHDHNLDADDDKESEGEAPPPGDQREVTSEYDESLISEPAGGDAKL